MTHILLNRDISLKSRLRLTLTNILAAPLRLMYPGGVMIGMKLNGPLPLHPSTQHAYIGHITIDMRGQK